MNYPDTAALDLSAFSHWPDALTASEEIAMWAQLGEYAQPGPAVEEVPLDIVDAVLARGPSRTTPTNTSGFDFEDNLVSVLPLGHDRTYIRHSLATGRPEGRWPRAAVPAIASLSLTLLRRVPRRQSQPCYHASSPTTRAHSVKKNISSPNQ